MIWLGYRKFVRRSTASYRGAISALLLMTAITIASAGSFTLCEPLVTP